MRILFDARWVKPGMTGVGKYAYHMLKSPVIPRAECGLILNVGSPFADEFTGYRIHYTGIKLTSHPATDAFEQFGIPWLCRRHGYRAFVSFEGRVPALHPGFGTFPYIYDLSYRLVPGSHSRKYSFFLALNAWLAKHFATSIVTISEAVRADLIRELGAASNRIAVAYPAGSVAPPEPAESDPPVAPAESVAPVPPVEPSESVTGLPKTFFLAVGITNSRKDLPVILNAFAQARATRPDMGLAVTGDARLIGDALRSGPGDGVHNLGFVSEGALRDLYARASGLICASRNEGFGIPLVDAAESGCPVVCTDIPVFREVMGDGAFYFPPGDAEGLAAAMLDVGSGSRPGGMPPRGKFTWDASARSLLDAINRLCRY